MLGSSPFLLGSSPFLLGSSPFCRGSSPFFGGSSPNSPFEICPESHAQGLLEIFPDPSLHPTVKFTCFLQDTLCVERISRSTVKS